MDIGRPAMRQDEKISLSQMSAARRAISLPRIAVVEHDLALLAEAPGTLVVRVDIYVMREPERESQRVMSRAGWTPPFVRNAIPKHRVALVAKPPVDLSLWNFGQITVWQHEIGRAH